MCVLLRINCVPPRVTSEPSVPPQHVIVWAAAFVLESFAFPPDAPSSIAPACAFSFPGWMVTVAVTLLPLPSDFVGTPLGATYRPLVEMNPTDWFPPVIPSTSQLTAMLGDPFTDA